MKSDYLEWPLLDWPRMGEKKRRIFDDSVITAATARGFAYGFFLGHLWDVLLWSPGALVAPSAIVR